MFSAELVPHTDPPNTAICDNDPVTWTNFDPLNSKISPAALIPQTAPPPTAICLSFPET